jgi:2-polyprenyl-3-methyl-5-hydroxy-6-metoxy-1,4-benzoquinol methylase
LQYLDSVKYYDANAAEYCQSTVGLDMHAIRERFTRELAPGAHILDAGSGSGRDSKAFLKEGFAVTLIDSSPEIARFASEYTGQFCRVLRFQDLDYDEAFEGIWACASLLHVAKSSRTWRE